VSTETAAQGLIGIGTPAPVAAAVGQSFEAIRDGQMAFVKETIKQVTGRQPRTFSVVGAGTCFPICLNNGL
jgi:hypothetical protein